MKPFTLFTLKPPTKGIWFRCKYEQLICCAIWEYFKLYEVLSSSKEDLLRLILISLTRLIKISFFRYHSVAAWFCTLHSVQQSAVNNIQHLPGIIVYLFKPMPSKYTFSWGTLAFFLVSTSIYLLLFPTPIWK